MRKITTVALILSLIVSCPIIVYANEPIVTEEVTRVREIEELRERNSDTYLLSDGSYECVIYSGNKYYETDNGKLAEIDNSIVSEELTVGDIAYAYANKANDSRIFFADNKPAVYIESAGNYLSFEMEDTQVTNAIPGGDKSMSPVSEFDLQGNNYIIYPDIKPQTDLVYEVRDNVLKEYIIIKGPNASADFTFSFGPDSLLEKDKQGNVIIHSKNGQDIFMLGTLFAVDSAGDYTEDLEYRIIEGTDGTKLEVSLSSEYMEKPGRAYPVLIDPTITGTNVTYDSYVSSNHASTNYYTSTYLKTGKSDTYHIRRSYIKFDIPLYLYKADVSGASLRLKKRGGVAPTTVKARRVTSSWTSSGITWSNKPSTADTGPYFLLESDNWYEANVLNIVRKWTDSGKTNRGFELRDDTESDMDHWTNFYSSDAESPNKPELSIIYNGKKARVLGVVNSGNHDHTSWLSPARVALNSCKSISNAYYSSGDFSVSQINGHLSNSTYNVFISRSHGGVKYYDSGSQRNTFIVLDDNASNYLKYESDDISGINSIDVSNMKLVIFIGCKTGVGGTSGYNLVSVAKAQGATTVVGFRDTVNCAKATLWAEKLCDKLKSGKDIYTACNELSSTSDFSNTNLVMSKIVIAGSTDTCLN